MPGHGTNTRTCRISHASSAVLRDWRAGVLAHALRPVRAITRRSGTTKRCIRLVIEQTERRCAGSGSPCAAAAAGRYDPGPGASGSLHGAAHHLRASERSGCDRSLQPARRPTHPGQAVDSATRTASALAGCCLTLRENTVYVVQIRGRCLLLTCVMNFAMRPRLDLPGALTARLRQPIYTGAAAAAADRADRRGTPESAGRTMVASRRCLSWSLAGLVAR